MMKQTLLSLGVVSATVILTACSSNGSNHIDKYFETPLISKPVDATGLKENAKKNAALLVKNELNATDFELKNYEISIGGKTYKDGEKVDLQDLGSNVLPAVTVTDIKEKFAAQVGSKQVGIEANRKAYLYQQKHSIVGTLTSITHTVDGKSVQDVVCVNNCDEAVLRGERTQVLPSSKASYTGVAWTRNTDDNPEYTMGSLHYEVDFDKKEGSGKIDGENGLSNIALEKANISLLQFRDGLDNQKESGQGVIGQATQNGAKGNYTLGFFGDKAQEVAGYVDFQDKKDTVDVAFSGMKKEK